LSEPATLPPIRYTLIEGDSPRTWRWALPEGELWRRENPQSTWPKPAPRLHLPDPLPLPHLVAQLESRTEIGAPLYALLREVYDLSPEQVTRIVSHVCEEADRGNSRSPGGLLYHRLKNLGKR
jgi:hypothetical protein